jgi:uncharacterized protein YdbL (DUF1318 family)
MKLFNFFNIGEKMRMFYSFLIGTLVLIGCAHVQVDAPKDPIKMDISMRLDVYQHVVKDIDDIENLVNGKEADAAKKLSDIIVPPAHADDMNPALREAALRRKDRLAEISSLEASGVIGEDKSALLALRGSSPQADSLIAQENSDRLIIYRSIAAQNGTPVEEVQKLYAQRLQAKAPSGTAIEKSNGEWIVKR